MIQPGDALYPALARVAAANGMTPDEWQEVAARRDEVAERRRKLEHSMCQIPRYRNAA